MMSLAGQTYAFLMTILAGAIVGFLFDVYRVFRAAFRPKNLATIVTDLLFWIVVTPTVFALLLAANWGELRAYVLLGLGIGLLLYFQALSSVVIWCLASTLRGVGHVVSSIVFGFLRALLFPLQLVFGSMGRAGRIRRRGGLGGPPVALSPRPKPRMAWQRISWARLFSRGG